MMARRLVLLLLPPIASMLHGAHALEDATETTAWRECSEGLEKQSNLHL
jgi:hypothetical protein